MRKLTAEELQKASVITATTRYDALDKLANVLETSTSENFRWVRNSKCITGNGYKIDITTKKNKNTGFVEIKRIDVFGVNKEWDVYELGKKE